MSLRGVKELGRWVRMLTVQNAPRKGPIVPYATIVIGKHLKTSRVIIAVQEGGSTRKIARDDVKLFLEDDEVSRFLEALDAERR
jgi:hypothetical protein